VWRFARVADPARLRLLLDAFGVTVIDDGRGGYEHNAALLVVDTRGRLVRVFDYDDLHGALYFASLLPATHDEAP
jgi:protein SCO1/2